MKTASILCALAALGGGESPAGAADPTVVMPPFVVSSQAVPWFSVRAGSIEVLSRCSAATTAEFVRKVYRAHQIFAALVPKDFRLKMSVPLTYILYGEDMLSAIPPEIREPAPRAGAGRPAGRSPNFAVYDQDEMLTAVLYHPSKESFLLDADCVRILLANRSPAPPAWLVEGFLSLYRRTAYNESQFQFAPQDWLSRDQTKAIQDDPESARRLIPPDELLAARQAAENPHDPEFTAVWRAETELLVRWGLENPDDTKQLWELAALSRAEPAAPEDMLQRCFGFGSAGLLDRLNDTLPVAVTDPQPVKLGPFSAPPQFEVRRASDAEVGIIMGDWERLETRYVTKNFPSLAQPYARHARQTLRIARGQAPGDAGVLAAAGLFEAEFGDSAEALRLLAAAAQAGVVRPRAYAELARLRYEEANSHPRGARGDLSPDQVAAVTEPIVAGRRQDPPIAQSYVLLGQAWLRCANPPPPEAQTLLQEGVRLFPADLGLLFLTASVEARHGMIGQASALIELGLQRSPEGPIKARFARLRAIVAAAR